MGFWLIGFFGIIRFKNLENMLKDRFSIPLLFTLTLKMIL